MFSREFSKYILTKKIKYVIIYMKNLQRLSPCGRVKPQAKGGGKIHTPIWGKDIICSYMKI